MYTEHIEALSQELENEQIEATELLDEIEHSAWYVVTGLRDLRSSLIDIEEAREHIERLKTKV